MRLLLLAIVSLANFGTTQCSGHLEIRLKSEFAQDLTVLVSEGTNPTLIALPLRVAAREEKSLKTFPLDYTKNYTLRILGGKVKELGLNGSSYVADFEPIRGTSSPKQLHLPLKGLELVFECDEMWAGPKCDIQSGSSESLPSHVLEVATDYTVDLEALPKIVDRLKETTKVENEIRNSAAKSETVLGTETIERITPTSDGKTTDTELLMEEKRPVWPKKEEKKRMNPFTDIFRPLLFSLLNNEDELSSEGPVVINLRTIGDEEEEVLPRTPTSSSLLQSFRVRMQEKRKEEEERRRAGVERHRESQQMLGMRHTTPRGLDVSQFSSLPFGPMELMSSLGKK